MEQQAKPIQFDEFLSNMPSIFEKIEREGEGVLVEHEGNIFSLKMTRPKIKSRKRSRGLTEDDSILNIIGIGESTGPTDTARNKHKYLADAYGDLHKR